MNLKNLARFFSIILAINFCGQIVYNNSTVEMVLEVDFDQDSEKEESKEEKESDKLNNRSIPADLELYLANALHAIHSQHYWVSPCLEISDPPPELG